MRKGRVHAAGPREESGWRLGTRTRTKTGRCFPPVPRGKWNASVPATGGAPGPAGSTIVPLYETLRGRGARLKFDRIIEIWKCGQDMHPHPDPVIFRRAFTASNPDKHR